MSKVTATLSEREKAIQLFETFLSDMPEISINTAHSDAPSGININDNEEVTAYLQYSFSQFLDSIATPDTPATTPSVQNHTKVLLTLDESGYPINAFSDGEGELELLIWDSDDDGIVDQLLPMPDGSSGVLTNLYTHKNPQAIEWASAIMDVNLCNFEFDRTTIELLSDTEIKIEQTGAFPVTKIIQAPADNAINMLHAIKQEFRHIHGQH
ncbi:hypothetical protein [Vibrio hippocampi]|uniref:Uncharacterized protein n=1 Tax=Vibrio hippocampi TaxID=654686 RepID=A0ABN8DQD6_9VIBR|nr:hypothetical protein [Vibrio hippocampi]CAH0530397.1 hypothetical protein VHP8226_04040 [Vibrio hippocampi]